MTVENVQYCTSKSGVDDGNQPPPLSIAVMVSGHSRGSNLGALMDACASGEIAGHISIVIGTRGGSPALERAQAAGIPVAVISPRKYENDDNGYAAAILRLLVRHGVGLICLAGYMRKLPTPVLERFPGRVMNIHAALLPLFGGQGMYGKHVHQAVLESGMKVSGCTVHFVDEQYDTGPIIVQNTVPVLEDDTSETLGRRVLVAEHEAYVQAVKLCAQDRLQMEDNRVRVLPLGSEE